MNRRRFIAGMTGGFAAVAALAPFRSRARGETSRQTSAPPAGEFVLVVPAPSGGGLGRLAEAIAVSLSDAGLISAPRTTYSASGPAEALLDFADSYHGRGDALMACGAGMAGAVGFGGTGVSLTELEPVARLITENMILAVRADSGFRSLADLLARLRREAGGVVFAGASLGSSDHLLVGMLARHVGVPAQRIDYRPFIGGIGAADAVAGGAAICVVGSLGDMLPDVSIGRLRALAISSSQRLPGVDIPTFVEQGVELRLSNWRGVFAPPGTDARQCEALCTLMQRMVASGTWRSKLFQHNWRDNYLAGAAFVRFVREEAASRREMLAALGLA